MNDKYYAALTLCVVRYSEFAKTEHDLLKFVKEIEEKINEQYPLEKLNRWIGYVQGCLIERGYTTVEQEREWSRPLFRPLDFK